VGDIPEKGLGRFVLRDLPIASRVVIAAFLMSVGFGYCSALVQLHFQGGTKPGELLPGAPEAQKTYAGERGPRPKSHIERLLEADETEKFNGTGQMRTAFTKKSQGWNGTFKEAKEKDAEAKDKGQPETSVKKLLAEREGERLAMLEWLRAGAAEKSFQKDEFPLPESFKDQSVTEEFIVKEDGMPRLKIKSLLQTRCACCHAPEAGRMKEAESYVLNSYATIKPYAVVSTSTGMSLTKLAQTTHVHLLGFSMLYGLTGFIFSFTSYPLWFRIFFAPFTLIMQLADIGCWWLARLHSPQGELFGQAIAFTGMLVAIGLMIHIIGTLFDLFSRKGKLVLLVLILIGGIVGGALKAQVIDPYLESEKAPAATAE
jgi:hypothetical protein